MIVLTHKVQASVNIISFEVPKTSVGKFSIKTHCSNQAK